METKRLLLIEPYADIIEPFTNLLAHFGYEVEAVQTGEAALAAALARPPGAVVVELCLYDMDGQELCHKLRKLPKMEACRFIVLTGNNRFLTKEAESCFDAVLLKPVAIEQLLTVLAN